MKVFAKFFRGKLLCLGRDPSPDQAAFQFIPEFEDSNGGVVPIEFPIAAVPTVQQHPGPGLPCSARFRVPEIHPQFGVIETAVLPGLYGIFPENAVCGNGEGAIDPVSAEFRQKMIQKSEPFLVRQKIFFGTEQIGIKKTDRVVTLSSDGSGEGGDLFSGRLGIGTAGKLEKRTAVKAHQTGGEFSVFPDFQARKCAVRKARKS